MARFDGELLQFIALRDQQALATLYARHGRLVFSLALHITAEQLDAEAVTQDVFVLVWQHYSVFRTQAGTVQGWIAAMTRQRAFDTLQSRQGIAGRRALALNDTVTAVPRPEGVCDPQLVLRDTVREALDSLPVTQRQAIELAYFGGLTTAEIASAVHEPVATIKSRLRLALTTIRQAVHSEFKVEQRITQDEQQQRDPLE